MAFLNEKKEDGKWQTIDRERNVVLSKVSGPDSEGNYHCELNYKGSVVRFDATSGMKIHGDPKVDEERQYEMNWKVFRLFIPEDIQKQKAEITSSITDALKAWGWNYRPDKTHSVDVQFLPNIA